MIEHSPVPQPHRPNERYRAKTTPKTGLPKATDMAKRKTPPRPSELLNLQLGTVFCFPVVQAKYTQSLAYVGWDWVSITCRQKRLSREDNMVRLWGQGLLRIICTYKGQWVGESPSKIMSFWESQDVTLIGNRVIAGIIN